MAIIERLKAEKFRQFDQFDLGLHPRVNVFRGANAAGKTSILEAIHFAARAASFRARRTEEIIQQGSDCSWLHMWARHHESEPSVRWSTRIQKNEIDIRRLDEVVSRKILAQTIPVVIADRQLHRVFDEGPVYRRRYVDWGLFYVEPKFFDLWRRHERVLRQRNHSLRQRLPRSQVEIWNREFIDTAVHLQELRKHHVQKLQPVAMQFVERLTGVDGLEFQLLAGWNESIGLEQVLQEGFQGDLRMGFTHAGPQRAELKIRFESGEARMFASRGQQKMLALGMSLAQASLVLSETERTPILMVDDLEAELSSTWQNRLIDALLEYPGQSMVTSLEWAVNPLDIGLSSSNHAVFHVEHGQVASQ